jgi:hypothetical protein
MDEYGSELTFSLLDELARATVRGRVAANEFLASRHLGRVGPLMELLLLDRTGTLPLSALPDCQTPNTLTAALSPFNLSTPAGVCTQHRTPRPSVSSQPGGIRPCRTGMQN